MHAWFESRYTGLFAQLQSIPLRAHDPALPMYGGALPPWGPRCEELVVGGAGWDQAGAKNACVGEAIERWQPYPRHADVSIQTSWRSWPLDEPALEPSRWVLFHPGQYAQPGFPFAPFTRETVCRWVCCRGAFTGAACWVPEEMVFLYPRSGAGHNLCPGVSTGLVCGRVGDPVLLRGLQEVIERDAVIGAWWSSYALEKWSPDRVYAALDPTLPPRLLRPNLRYRFYRVLSPFSDHVTIVTLEGEDKEGYCFSIGSACRETRSASWQKALLEAVQGRHYVRYLKPQFQSRLPNGIDTPTDFAGHAVYYTLYPEKLATTALCRAREAPADPGESPSETLATLAIRLGPEKPILFRNLTPPAIAQEVRDWYVLRVLVPGLQPLHGNHSFAHLGGKLWAPRGLADWRKTLPHPFP
jgi:ribosomal protein S12 methylthiotransferase accessory factor